MLKKHLYTYIASVLTSCFAFTTLYTDKEIDLQEYFDEYQVEGSFVLYDLKENQFTRFNPTRCQERFIPASTFKIPNSLIALEEGILKDQNSVIFWDGKKWWNETWNRDMTLAEAFKFSCVPCYIQIAGKVGDETYQKYLKSFDYGNIDISGAKERAFWLDGNLKISQEEQISFLRKLYDNELPVSQRSIDILKDIMLLEDHADYKLRAKSGWAITPEKEIGWFVGYVEKENNTYIFATNIESQDAPEAFGSARKEITMRILKKLEII